MSNNKLPCFKSYDIRGRVPEELNPELAFRIGASFAKLTNAKNVVVGMDVRQSSRELKDAFIRGACSNGARILDIGLCGTEEVYFATSHLDADGGVMITASHNPIDYNGMKFVGKGSTPISWESGLKTIHDEARDDTRPTTFVEIDVVDKQSVREAYVEHLLGYVSVDKMSPFRITVNPGNGGAGDVLDVLAPRLPFTYDKVNYDPNGTFPNGIPNPLLPEKRDVTANSVIASGANFGLAWDGDFDRCFFFDENGRFIEGYYVVGLLAEMILQKNPGAKIVHDPRLEWATREIVSSNGGTPVRSKTGHALIKEIMRSEDAVYGGEMSAHHYFRDFYYCDSGMIPWLLIAELVSIKKTPLSKLVDDMITAYPVSGEINRSVTDAAAVLDALTKRYQDQALNVDTIDGVSMEMEQWRFNIRSSNTEPVIRLNVETRGDKTLLDKMTTEILSIVEEFLA